MEKAQLIATVTALLRAESLARDEVTLSAMGGGGNNRVFLATSEAGRFVVKAYFNDPADSRDRLGAEYAFLAYARDIGLDVVPQAIARDTAQHIGVYEFIAGQKMTASQLRREHVLAAAQFIADLNADTRHGHALAPASEACFEVEQHLAIVDRRLAALQKIPTNDVLGREVHTLVREMAAWWRSQRPRITSSAIAPLDSADRCISPSDFGFHNALSASDGQLHFIDFEYAGWDDPAKMAGDFFCQPEVPVPSKYVDDFMAVAFQYSPRAQILRDRTASLLPAAQIKWCCIMLNEFLVSAARRRQFADPSSTPEQRKRAQLDKAHQFFHSRLA
ncbi:hypothetical protein GWL_06250 [Herbaspirillum sp. GW103]|jgi:hypothetical protein|uniref:aminoglycoside phosphotransferase family protein n=1 Tax=Herbaspirillum sp. GW103 TaxID=1175306 RepID=UPI00025E2A88|nr:aminoglycoside phosphotransferase family protein [Herbaspirillum sp. GW103]EIJ48591.1 hypothetical protein GWL_06250 [Herbaspirillum sp. GW103]